MIPYNESAHRKIGLIWLEPVTCNVVSDAAWQIFAKRCEYIAGIDWRRANMVGIRDGSNYASDYFARRARILHPTEVG